MHSIRQVEVKSIDIKIKPLIPELAADFFDFFDNRAFTDNEEFSCCYCTWFHMNKESERQVGKEVKADGREDALRRALRSKAENLLCEETLHGYLAYVDGIPIGWCNANNKNQFLRFDFDANLNEFICNNSKDKVNAVTCFVIAPEYRRKGVSTALLERVIQDSKTQGYAVVEGYPRLYERRDAYNYTGPFQLYEKCGFIKAAEQGNVAIMRKELR